MTDTETTIPAEPTRAELRDERYATMRRQLEWNMTVLAAFSGQDADLEPPDALWTSPGWTFHADPELEEVRQRAEALAFLAKHTRAIVDAGRLLGIRGLKIEKLNPEDHGGVFGVRAVLRPPGPEPLSYYPYVIVEVRVPAEVTCELVPTGEVEEIPAQPARSVPKMRRKCPPSIFAGLVEMLPDVEDEVPPAEDSADAGQPFEPF